MERAALAQRLALAACPGSGRTSFDLLLKTTERESKTSLFFLFRHCQKCRRDEQGAAGWGRGAAYGCPTCPPPVCPAREAFLPCRQHIKSRNAT